MSTSAKKTGKKQQKKGKNQTKIKDVALTVINCFLLKFRKVPVFLHSMVNF